MKTAFLYVTFLFGSQAILAQNSPNFNLFIPLAQFQNPAFLVKEHKPSILYSLSNNNYEERSTYFLSYNQPLSKSKFGLGFSYFLDRQEDLQLQELSLYANMKAQINPTTSFRLGIQVNFLNQLRTFHRNSSFITGSTAPIPVDFAAGELSDKVVDCGFGGLLE